VTGAGSIFTTHFTDKEVKNARDTFEADRKRLAEYHTSLIAMGVFFLPTHFGSISAAHTDADIEKLFQASEDYAKAIGKI
jgi:glutamate-1-semialdehyde aminotransferase